MRGAKPNPRSKRARLVSMAPGDVELFLATSTSYESTSRAVTSDLCCHLPEIKIEFSIRRALLVFDEHSAPVAVCVVTRKEPQQ